MLYSWIDEATTQPNRFDVNDFNVNSQRKIGFQANTTASSKTINTALTQAMLITNAIASCFGISSSNLTNAEASVVNSLLTNSSLIDYCKTIHIDSIFKIIHSDNSLMLSKYEYTYYSSSTILEPGTYEFDIPIYLDYNQWYYTPISYHIHKIVTIQQRSYGNGINLGHIDVCYNNLSISPQLTRFRFVCDIILYYDYATKQSEILQTNKSTYIYYARPGDVDINGNALVANKWYVSIPGSDNGAVISAMNLSFYNVKYRRII